MLNTVQVNLSVNGKNDAKFSKRIVFINDKNEIFVNYSKAKRFAVAVSPDTVLVDLATAKIDNNVRPAKIEDLVNLSKTTLDGAKAPTKRKTKKAVAKATVDQVVASKATTKQANLEKGLALNLAKLNKPTTSAKQKKYAAKSVATIQAKLDALGS